MTHDAAPSATSADLDPALWTKQAAAIGLATESRAAFPVALAIAVAGGLYAGDIRPRPSPR